MPVALPPNVKRALDKIRDKGEQLTLKKGEAKQD